MPTIVISYTPRKNVIKKQDLHIKQAFYFFNFYNVDASLEIALAEIAFSEG